MNFDELALHFSGELYFNESVGHNAQKIIYATDASVYQEKPVAVAIPKTNEDIRRCIAFARENQVSIIPRAAGTSLAGQVVGNGLVVDISKYFKKVLELNVEERWVRVQPGIIRDDLNLYLQPYGLMYAPETSTSNRAMIGGMIGNNSCGLHSIVWGDARRHLLEATVFLSDGSETVFKKLSAAEIAKKAASEGFEGNIYSEIEALLSHPATRETIETGYPQKTLTRRNTGYALDLLLSERQADGGAYNLCQLLAGSEGTLAFITEAKLQLIPLPPKETAVVCIHCRSLSEALHANTLVLQHAPMASELVDKFIMDFTIGHPTYHHNRFFIEGEPEAMLMVEFMETSNETLDNKTGALINDLRQQDLGYAWPVVKGKETKMVWDLRKAGLGLIRNLPGDKQPVNLIEDCAVPPESLPAYIEELQQVLNKYQLTASYYAHAGAGEIHVEPMINLKTQEGKEIFRNVLKDTVPLVKKYNGSLSGEHGDGRLRGEFIPHALGTGVYELLEKVKNIFDPQAVFNANKIVHTPQMNSHLRYEADQQPPKLETVFDFTGQEGILRMAEKCSGSGDCRRSHLSGGTMCPSYMATLEEKDSTRARANILRQFLTQSPGKNPFNHPEIKEVMDLCLSCKACKSECPSSVDVAKMKAEFLQHYYDANGIPFRTRVIASFSRLQSLGILMPGLYNFFAQNAFTSGTIKRIIRFAPKRSLPLVGRHSLRSWYKKWSLQKTQVQPGKKVVLFCDEFTNYNDVEIGKKAILLLERLGYEVVIPAHGESGRTYLSKGLIRKAKEIITENVRVLHELVSPGTPLIGIEPSAILTFRDEALDLVPKEWKEQARHVSVNSFMIEEFLLQEFEKGNIRRDQFTRQAKNIQLHGHCYQKSFGLTGAVKACLSIPENYRVSEIPSGCCGMAGAFGFEKEHYETSMKVGELVLLPAVRKLDEETIVAASGTSCRHQVKDGANRRAYHPVEILWEACEVRIDCRLRMAD